MDNLGKDPGKVKMRDGKNADEEETRDGENNEEEKQDGKMEEEEDDDEESKVEKEREQELTGRQDGWFFLSLSVVFFVTIC